MIRKFFALILIFVFIPIFVFTLFAQAALTSLLNPNLYKESLERTSAYERILKQALPEVIDQFPNEGESILSLIGKKETESLLVGTIKPEELQKLTEDSIDQILPYLTLESETVKLSYNIKNYKNNFSSNIKKLLITKLTKLPVCTSNQLQSLASDPEKFPTCRPQGQNGVSLYNQLGLEKEVSTGLRNLPDEITITPESIQAKPKGSLKTDPSNSPISGLSTARENIANISKIRTLAAAILIILALLILVLRLPSWRSIFSWLGSVLLIAGASVTLLAMTLRFTPFFTSRLGDILGFPKGISSLVTDVGNEIVGNITYQIFIISVPILIVGIVLIVATFFGKKVPAGTLPLKSDSL